MEIQGQGIEDATRTDDGDVPKGGDDDVPTGRVSSLSVPSKKEMLQKTLSLLLPTVAGVMIPFQACVNTNLGKHALSMPLPAAAVNFFVGLVIVAAVAMLHKPDCSDQRVMKAPWYAFMGGVVGSIYVVAAIFLSDRMGLVSFQLCATVGQLVGSLSCDTVGFLHLKKTKPTPARVVVLVLTGASTVLASSDFDSAEPPWRLAIFCLIAFIGGFMAPVAVCFNFVMGTFAGSPFRAVIVHYIGGFTLLALGSAVMLAVTQERLEVSGGEPWMWTGGVLGSIFVTCNLLGIPALGAGPYTTVALASQLTTATALDAVGAFGFPVIPPTPLRLCAVALAVTTAVLAQLLPAPSSKAPPMDEPMRSPSTIQEMEMAEACVAVSQLRSRSISRSRQPSESTTGEAAPREGAEETGVGTDQA